MIARLARLVRRIAFGALIAVGACAPAYKFRVDSRFDTTERAGLARAADEWNKRSIHRITFDEKGAWQVLKEEGPISARDDDNDPRTPDVDWNGECSRKRKTVWIHPLSSEDEYTVGVHEFGHALGLGHTTTGIMMAYKVSVEFTPEVMAECRRVKACR